MNRQKGKSSPSRRAIEPNLAKFGLDPVKGADSLVRLRRKEEIARVLADPELTSAFRTLALKAAQSPSAAVSLSRIALRSDFSAPAIVAIAANGEWPDPSKFSAPHRRLAADALERSRPSWALSWIGKALVSALPYAELRRYFMSRLFLAAGGFQGAITVIGNLLSALEPRGKKHSDYASLIEELLSCARPAHPASGGASAFVNFAQAIKPDRSSKGGAELKGKLAELLQLAASADRALLLEEPFLALAGTLDPDVGSRLRAEADRLFRPAPPPEPPALPPIPAQADLIREAAWSEADEALGRALQDTGRLLRSFERLESVVDGDAADHTRRAKDASDLVLQWVRQAARQRAVTALGKVGDRVPYDPKYHDCPDSSPGDVVRVVKPPIVRGTGKQQVVLLLGEVELD